MDIVHLRHNEAATGCVKTELFEDNLFYEKMMGSERAAVATSHYCPSCSKTQEYDRKLGRYKRKFRINKEDYIFNVDGVGHSQDDIKIVRDYEIIDYAEQNSCYVIEFKAFMEFFSNKKKGTITDMIINKKVGEENYKYILSIDNIDVKKLKVNSGKYIEIPKSYWKSEGERV